MAIVRYAGNRMTGLSSDTKPTESSLITGTTFQETNTDDLYVWTVKNIGFSTGPTLKNTRMGVGGHPPPLGRPPHELSPDSF